nr:probable RNA helicase armi [Leptinotarsa decemlineata]
MWGYISSFFKSNPDENDLSYEKACSILNTFDKVEEKGETITNHSKSNLVSNKIGTITKISGNEYIIDDLYTFQENDSIFELGSKVSYHLVEYNEILKVLNVKLVNEWDCPRNDDSLWHSRVLICKVEKRMGRKLILSPWDVTLNLDDISLEFLPLVGDWLEIHAKCTINESNFDLSGQILEINKVSPVRLHIESGKVTCWRAAEQTGVVNNNIYFNKQALSMGYIPFVGDRIIGEVIESDQERCRWRAIKILPEHISTKLGTTVQNNSLLPDFQETYPGLTVSDVNISVENLNDVREFSVIISNESECNFDFSKAHFSDPKSNCIILNGSEKVVIPKGTKHEVTCQCTSRNMGVTRELLLLEFDKFTIGKWINITVLCQFNKQKSSFEYKSKLPLHEKSTNELLRGHKLGSTSRFTAAQLPSYLIPQKLLKLFSSNDRNDDIDYKIEQLRVVKPSVVSNLSFMNYEDKFHSLLHLDEIANLIAIRIYDQEKACFISNGDLLMLEIENLSERRPSIVIGDKIIANDPFSKNKLDFEGIVSKVGAKHVYMRFNNLFHDKYRGEDYSIKVIPGRTAYRRLHHAVHLAVRNLGQEVLFPSKVTEKSAQILFDYESFETPNGITKRKVQNVLDKMKQYKAKMNSSADSSTSSQVQKLKLEWYNKKLNPVQKFAIVNILWGEARPLPYIIFGPPGTGKTVTLIEAILQIIRLLPHSRILVTAPSNSAADLIALRLINSGVLVPGDLVRVISHNYAMSEAIPIDLIPYCATGSNAKEGTAMPEMSSSGIQFDCSRTVLGRHRITVATCSAAGQFFSMGFPKGHFSHIIVDEAAQAGEPDVMIPLSFLDKNIGQAILAGDPLQLGPVILSKIASECGLNESYLERLINRFPYVRDPEGFPDTFGYDPRLVTKLLYNYRSLPDILSLYNSLFYENELISTIDDESSDEAKLVEKLRDMLPQNNDGKLPRMIFHGVDGENLQNNDSPSWYNPHEAAQVFYYINEFYRLGLSSGNIGVITPYIKQMTLP